MMDRWIARWRLDMALQMLPQTLHGWSSGVSVAWSGVIGVIFGLCQHLGHAFARSNTMQRKIAHTSYDYDDV